MKQYRLLAFGILGLVVALVATFSRRGGGIDAAGFPLLLALSVFAGLYGASVVVDTVWHAFQGRGQACRYCGHLRQMSSFRVYGNCPNCGK